MAVRPDDAHEVTSSARDSRASSMPLAEPTAATSRLPLAWGLFAVGALLLLSMVAVGLVQWRQLSSLDSSIDGQGESALMLVHRAELEFMRLNEGWPRPGANAPGFDAAGLPARIDPFASAIGQLRQAAGNRLLAGVPEVGEAIAQGERFVAHATQLSGSQEPPPQAEQWAVLRTELQALGPVMHAMSLRADQAVFERAPSRQAAVQRHNLVGTAVTLFLSLLTLAFALVALRQLQRQQLRRQALESLSASLHDARREAEAANAAKSAFLAHMSHELRTPFQGLLGMLSLLRESGLDPRQQDQLRTATESADHLLRILNDLLDLSQLESGRLALSPVPVELRAMLREVDSLMRPQALRKGLALHLDTSPAVPDWVELDPTRVKQVLFNLLANAIKFTGNGNIVLDVQRAAADAAAAQATGETLVFTVTDTGVGMDEPTLAALFTREAPRDRSRTRRHGGAGLGLAISRDLAKLMGGTLAARSHLGQGSSFVFTLPLRASRGRRAADGHERGAGAVPALNVLVAEDHDVNRQYIAAVLESLGHHARYAANGQEAVEAARAQRFDLVLMDLHMPVMDGIEATRAIRGLPDAAKAGVPIVALTADAFDDTRDRCLVAGMNDFLTKPISAQELSARLRRLFGQAAGREAGAGGARGDGSPRPSASALLDQTTINAALQAMPRERFVGLVRAFLDDAPVTLERMRAALRDAQPLDLRVNAHAARGAALNLGMSALAATAEALQEGAAHLPAHEVVLLVQRFESQLQESREAMQGLGLWAASATR